MSDGQRKILVIEDELATNEYLKTALEAEGFETVGVLSGKEGLLQLERSKFDIVLLDIMMKDLDGIETCRLIREKADLQSMPVCMITASVDVEKVVTAFKAGADGYIVKPFDLDELLTKVEELTSAGAGAS